MNGKGEFFWPGGKFFKGSYLDDKKDGSGVFRWPDGRQLQGSWKNGNPVGSALMTDADGKVMEIDYQEIQNLDLTED